jgi:ADP-ribosylglycohydrolase
VTNNTKNPKGEELFEFVLQNIEESDTKNGIIKAYDLFKNEKGYKAKDVAMVVGSGYNVIAQDTVPFSIWCAAKYIEDYEEGMWETVSGLGDRDTTCAIVGGIISCS